MTIDKICLCNGEESFLFSPNNSSYFMPINEPNELHTFIDIENPVTSIAIGPWFTNKNLQCLFAISYERAHWIELDDNDSYKGGIIVYLLDNSNKFSYKLIHDTRFNYKPLCIIWNKCNNNHNIDDYKKLSCCNMITCLFDNGDLEVFDFIKNSGKLVRVFNLALGMQVTSITTSHLNTSNDVNKFYIAVATDVNELILIRLYDQPVDIESKDGYMTFKNNDILYKSSIMYKTITFNIDYLSTSHIQKMAITCNSDLIAMGSSMGMVTIWDMRYGKSGELANYTVSNRPIYQLLWTNDSKYLIGYSNSLFIIDWFGSRSISHYEVTPYHHQPLCHGLRINSKSCFMVIRNELVIFSLEQLLSHIPFKFMGFEWFFSIENDIIHTKSPDLKAKLSAGDILERLNLEIASGHARLCKSGLKIVRGVKNYRSGKSTKRQKGGKSEFLVFNTNALKLLDHGDFVLSPTCIDIIGDEQQFILYGGSSGLVHLILLTN